MLKPLEIRRMAKTKRADTEWLWHMQEDIQRKIDIERRQLKLYRKRRMQPQPAYPSAKELYGAAISHEEY